MFFVNKFSNKTLIYFGVLGLVLIGVLLFEKSNVRKVNYMLIGLFIPFFGVGLIFLFFVQKFCDKSIIKDYYCKKNLYNVAYLDLKNKNNELLNVVKFVHNKTNFPLLYCQRIEYINETERFLGEIINTVSKAKNYVLLEFYIYKNSQNLNLLTSAIYSALSRGVKVEIAYDYFASFNLKTSSVFSSLSDAGCKVYPYKKIGTFIGFNFNKRNHRKIAVIDGEVGFLGGINFSNEEKLPSKDCGLKVFGDGAKQIENMFYRLIGTGREFDFLVKNPNNGYILPFSANGKAIVKQTLLNLIRLAKKQVVISTPYLSLDEEMVSTLKYLLEIGVSVKIMLAQNRSKIVQAVNYSYAKELCLQGVEIYYYKPKFLHQKMIVIDDNLAFLGSANFDYRSFNYQVESGIIIYDNSVIAELLLDFNISLSQCVELKAQKKEKFFESVYLKFLRLFSYFF